MESQDDKILADKLNGLHSLPAGYTPDLSSKWEIVEAGLPPQNKRRIAPVLIRWSAAAAVLLAITFLWVNSGKRGMGSIAAHDTLLSSESAGQVNKKQHQPLFAAAPQSADIGSEERKALQTISKKTPAKYTTKISKKQPENQLVKIAVITPPEVALSQKPAIVTSMSPVDSLTATNTNEVAILTSAEKSKPAKRKIYQRNFNDNTLVLDTGFTATNSQHFSIKLLPFSRKKASADEQPARLLQLKQTL